MARKDVSTQDVVSMHQVQLLTLRQIAKIVGMSHVAVAKRLRGAGVDPGQTIFSCACDHCGQPFSRPRSHLKRTKQRFCSPQCYGDSLVLPTSYRWRQGMRIARMVVSQHFTLPAGSVVHHKDGDNRNNDLSNLVVFASQGDHAAFHRGVDVIPLFDGAAP